MFNILEGIAPAETGRTPRFDQPLDILVTFHAAGGRNRPAFSFNELIMTGDSQPVTLAL